MSPTFRCSSSNHTKMNILMMNTPDKTMAFLTHDWGVDEDGSKNHDVVSRVNEYLKAKGIVTWFDNDHLRGLIQHDMTKGVDNTGCAVAFVTKNYLEKVSSVNMLDNCCFEFTHASQTLGGNKFISCPSKNWRPKDAPTLIACND